MKKQQRTNRQKTSQIPESIFYHLFKIDRKYAAIIWTDSGKILRLFLPQQSKKLLCEQITSLQNRAASKGTPDQHLESIKNEVIAYFSGSKTSFKTAKLHLDACTDFAQKVYLQLRQVPFGQTISYGELARRAGKPNAARAVGRAVGANPVPLIIPCHRVITGDGKIGGFSSAEGVEQKRHMLALEGIASDQKILPANARPASSNTDSAIKTLCTKDPQLATWIKKLPRFELQNENMTSTFQSLLEAIVYQQLTGKAAGTIYARVLALFGTTSVINPLDIIRAKDSELRKAGLSGPKILAIRDLAEKTLAGEVPEIDQLRKMSDEEIISTLVKIRGIGRWTAEMLLIFKLGRPDVLAIDDYGLKKGFAILRGWTKLPSPAQLRDESTIWQPYRTIASWYLWRIAETGRL